MPTITLYVTDEAKRQLDHIIKKRSKAIGKKVSRSDLLVPHINNLYKQEFPPKTAHMVGQPAPVMITGELAGVVVGSAAQEVKA